VFKGILKTVGEIDVCHAFAKIALKIVDDLLLRNYLSWKVIYFDSVVRDCHDADFDDVVVLLHRSLEDEVVGKKY